jgi:CTP synthase (UTP-ammonia lyase)
MTDHSLHIAIIGDYNPRSRYHLATGEALRHAGEALSTAVEYTWLPTPALDSPGYETLLEPFDALWCAPGSPYESMQGALNAIQFARERDWPFTGT